MDDLLAIDELIRNGVLIKVNGSPSPHSDGKRCLLVMCGDMNHRKDVQEFCEKKFSSHLHLLKLPGGAAELSPRSPRNRQFPSDFCTRMRDVVRAIVAQNLNHIILMEHYKCGAATLDNLDPIGSMLLVKDAKRAIIQTLRDDQDLKNSVAGADFWKPGEQDISCFLHCFAGSSFTEHIRQERTTWFVSSGLESWIEQHQPKLIGQLLLS